MSYTYKHNNFKWVQDKNGAWFKEWVILKKGEKRKGMYNKPPIDWYTAGKLQTKANPNKQENNVFLYGFLDKQIVYVIANDFKTSARQCDYLLRIKLLKNVYCTLARLWVRKVKDRPDDKILVGRIGLDVTVIVVKTNYNLDKAPGQRAEYLIKFHPVLRDRKTKEDIDKYSGYKDPKFELDYSMLNMI